MGNSGIERAGERRRTAGRHWRPLALLLAATMLAGACASGDDDATGGDVAEESADTGGAGDEEGDADEAGSGDEADGADGADDGGTDDAGPLGPEDPASGDPVRVGLISNGPTATIDNQIELDVAAAAVEWINAHRGGIGGRPIELVTCVDEGDPARSEECADQMVQDDVVAVMIGSHSQLDAVYSRLDASQVPTMIYGGSGAATQDTDNTFILGSGDFTTVELPVGTAEEVGATKVLGVIIDVPAAIDGYRDGTVERVTEGTDIELEVVPVPLGTADMTVILQPALSDDVGVVHVLGNDSFCIAAFNALEQLGYEGEITSNAQCVSEATIEQVSGEVLDGIRIGAVAPVGEENESTELYEAVIGAFSPAEVDTTRTTGYSMFSTFAGFDVALEGLEGEVTRETVVAAIETMETSELPGAGGLLFRCDRTINPADPAVCMRGGLVTVLGADGQPRAYEVVGNELD